MRGVDGPVYEKSMDFAVGIVRLYQCLVEKKKEYVLSKQLLRSGTSIGANVREAKFAQSKKDFVSKMNIALKEAGETEYWLELLQKTDYLTESESKSILKDCIEIKKIIHAIVKTTKANLNS